MGSMTADKVKEFHIHYASLFGRLTESDGAERYNRWVREKVDLGKLLEVLDEIAVEWSTKQGKPKFDKIQILYKKKLTKAFFPDPYKREPPPLVCSKCEKNSGIVWIVVGKNSNGGWCFFDGSGSLSDYMVRDWPCVCQYGQQNNVKFFDKDDDMLDVAKKLKLGWKKFFPNETEARKFIEEF